MRQWLCGAPLLGAILMSVPATAQQGGSPTAVEPPAARGGELNGSAGESASLDHRRSRAKAILLQMLPDDVATSMGSGEPLPMFGGEMSRLAFENSYMQLWARPGISLKERSLVTISMLIAMGNEKELSIHIASGLRNGLTVRELEEVIYHATAYVGFPRASDALAIASKVVAQEGKQ